MITPAYTSGFGLDGVVGFTGLVGFGAKARVYNSLILRPIGSCDGMPIEANSTGKSGPSSPSARRRWYNGTHSAGIVPVV